MNKLKIRNLEAVCDFHGCPDIFDFFYHEVYEPLSNIEESSELVEKCYQAALSSKDPKSTIRAVVDQEIKRKVAEMIARSKSLLSQAVMRGG